MEIEEAPLQTLCDLWRVWFGDAWVGVGETSRDDTHWAVMKTLHKNGQLESDNWNVRLKNGNT